MDQETRLNLAWQIVDRLEASGRRAWLVGGCVRDKLLGRPLKDVDIATSAKPDEVLSLFERAEPTGLAHGTVTVIVKGVPYEVTTLRSESGYSDGRRPDEVRFIADIREDLSRRDFTVNAMALERDGKLVDPFGGERDLEAGILRAVGKPGERFGEDALRMLRAVRFAAEYGLAVEPATWRALVKMAPRIGQIAIERVRMELERITEGSDPAAGFLLLAESGLYRHFKTPLPLDRLPADPAAAFAGLVHCRDGVVRWARIFRILGLSAETASSLMKRLAFSRRKTAEISAVVAFDSEAAAIPDGTDDPTATAWKRLVLRHGRTAATRWLALQSVTPDASIARRQAAAGWLRAMPACSVAELAVSGRTLMEEAGVPAGPQLGALLNRLLEKVALGELPNARSELVEAAGEMAGNRLKKPDGARQSGD